MTTERTGFKDNAPVSSMHPAVVLGLNPNGLGVVRSLHAAGVPVIGVDRRPQGVWDTNIWMSSHTLLCRKVFYETPGDEGLLDCLLSLGRTLNKPGILFPSADAELLCISRNREPLSEYFLFRVPDADTVELLADKALFYEFAKGNGIASPLTYVDPTPNNIDDIAAKIGYPCLIKPHQRSKAWNKQFSNRKVLIAGNGEELIAQFRLAHPEHPNILVQEIVPGPDSNLFFSHVYMSEDLTPLAIWTGRKIRQRPIHFGTSTMTETVWVEAVAEASVSILRHLKCVGYSSIEFKKDTCSGEYKIMEVTQGRTWYPHFLGFGAGVNIPLVWYRDLAGATQTQAGRAKEGVRWIDECRDPAASLNYWRNGELTFPDWVRSYRKVSVYTFASLRDPLPMVFVVQRFAFELVRAIYRGIRRTLSRA